MISNFNEEAQEILNKARQEMLDLKHPYIGTEHLVLAILHTNNELSQKLQKYDLNYENFKQSIIDIIGKGSKKSEFFLHTPLLKKVIENSIIDSKENNNGIVTINHLFSSILYIGEGIAIRIFMNMNIDIDDIYDEFTEKIYNRNKNQKKLLIEEIGININNKVKNNETDPVIDRDEEIKKIEEILCRRTKNNPLLIGPPGVGKTAIVEGLATLIEKEEVPRQLLNKKIISLDMASTVAGTKYRGEFEERMKKILEEIENNDEIILFIDEIHTLIGAGGAEGAIDASNILKPALARGKIRCIGATTNDEYKKHFEKDKALDRRFQIINIKEPTIEQTRNILYNLKPIYENYHNVIINDEIINTIITLSEKYLYDRYSPDKEIDILDEVCSKVNIKECIKFKEKITKLKEIRDTKKEYIDKHNIQKAYEYKIKEAKFNELVLQETSKKIIKEKDVAEVISNKSLIEVYDILKDNKKNIQEIETKLKKEIIGQKEAINKLINITKKIKLGYNDQLCTSLLFIGPPGVGKTKLATLYGELISKQKPIKIDMTEYSDSSEISKFTGSNPGYVGYGDNKYVLNTIKENPNSTIIFDEIDKAHPKIINLLYQILEDGKIKDSKNNTINLRHNIIIMTSNINTENNNIGFNQNQKSKEYKNIFNNALISRIYEIIEFNQLTKKDILKIINKSIDNLKERYNNLNIKINNSIYEELLEEADYNKFGARKIKNIIIKKIENNIIDNILNNKKEVIIDSIFSK